MNPVESWKPAHGLALVVDKYVSLKNKSYFLMEQTLMNQYANEASASDVIKQLQVSAGPKGFSSKVLIDVRSEKEFEKGHFPGAINIPILSDEIRHLVGLTYKTEGPKAATSLGYELVGPKRLDLVQRWSHVVERAKLEPTFLYCWRGGQRSQIACEWMKDQGGQVVRIEGGFKALRREVMEILTQIPTLLVVSGMTGVGKTDFLSRHFQNDFLDLEGLASHRGSAFGGQLKIKQPSSVLFEAKLALKLMEAGKTWLVEDESRRIGRLQVPPVLYESMATATVILLQVPLEQRINNIFSEYVSRELQAGWSLSDLVIIYKKHLFKIKDSLGMQLYLHLQSKLELAFSQGSELQDHSLWIGPLLEKYYDRLYTYSLKKKNRKILFEGTTEECLEVIRARLKSVKS